MSKHNRPFKFKQFEVSHHRSSMKIGVDAVILGVWANIKEAHTVLDVGCGCGVISLIIAQRNQKASIISIDIDPESIAESIENISASPWNNRIRAELIDFSEFCLQYSCNNPLGIDYIISNPPYFDSGIDNPSSTRLKARHQDSLSPSIILEKGRKLLSRNGIIGMVVPIEQTEEIVTLGTSLGLSIVRKLILTGREGRAPKRCFIEFGLHHVVQAEELLTIEFKDGSFTPEYRSLCKDFYLKF